VQEIRSFVISPNDLFHVKMFVEVCTLKKYNVFEEIFLPTSIGTN